MHTIAVGAGGRKARKRSSNAPGDGAAVSGSTGEVATLRQNSSLESSTRSTNSSSPKRIVSGTISMPSASARACGRSQALSVTMRTATRPPGTTTVVRR